MEELAGEAENSKTAYTNTKKNCKSFKLDKSNDLSVGTTSIKLNLSICLVGLVWFAGYCGKMYSRHIFSYGGLRQLAWHNPSLHFKASKVFCRNLLMRIDKAIDVKLTQEQAGFRTGRRCIGQFFALR